MNSDDIVRLSEERLSDAQALFAAGRYEGAYHFAGLAVECALKAHIARFTGVGDFPDRDWAQAVWTHDLNKLLAAAVNPVLPLKKLPEWVAKSPAWLQLAQWSVDSRYDPPGTVTKEEVAGFLDLVADAKGDLVSWLRTFS